MHGENLGGRSKMLNVLNEEKHSPDSRSQASVELSSVVSVEGGGRPYGTWKDTLLESVPLGVTTLTSPVVAPAGTVVVISELDTTVNWAAVPLKVTLVAPVRLVPRMLTAAPAPEAGCVSTNGPRPTDRL
jgi:hypothetical protein